MGRTLIPALCLALAACTAGTGASERRGGPRPTLPPPLPTIATTPSLAGWVAERVLEFRASTAPEPGGAAYSALRLAVEVMPLEAALEAARSGIVELVIAGSEPPEGWFATPVGIEGIAIVVHPSNPVNDLDMDALHDLFAGLIGDWEAILPSSAPVQPIIPLPGDEIRVQLEEVILRGRRPALTSMLGPSPQALAALVAEHEGAIGLLPAYELNDTVRAVRIEGVSLSQATLDGSRYPLRLELAAFAPQEPVGAVRDWLAWLQAIRTGSAR